MPNSKRRYRKNPQDVYKRQVRRGELDPVTNGELTSNLAIDADAGQAAGIVGDEFAGCRVDGKQVRGWVDGDNCSIGAALDSESFATAGVADHIAGFVVVGPPTVGPGHVLALDKDAKGIVVRCKGSIGFQFLTDGDIQLTAGGIIG